MNIFITGVAGFIGSKLAKSLLQNKHTVYGIDNLNSYYSVKLKKLRIKELKKFKKFHFIKTDLNNINFIKKITKKSKIHILFHLAAQAGVRFTLSNPEKYFDDNIKCFFNILEFAKAQKIKKIFFASSSSVYGDQKIFPLKEKFNLNEKNIYGFSKRINELTAKFYANKFDLQIIGLRFFTVFGEWGRPDMLIFKYLKTNLENKVFYLNSNGEHFRDFTYIDDVIKTLNQLIRFKLKTNYDVFNICANKPQKIINVVNKINIFNKNFKFKSIESKELNKIEVKKTHGSNKKIKKILKNRKFINFDYALNKTVKWYLINKINKIT